MRRSSTPIPSKTYRANGRPRLLVTRPGGYILQIAPGQLDVHRFEQLCRRSTRRRAAGSGREAELGICSAAGQPWTRVASSFRERFTT
jgi:hypothetical protein